MRSIFDSGQFNQNLFFPRPDRFPSPPGKEEIYVEVEPGMRIHVRRHPAPGARFSLLYFHGNGEIVSDYDDMGPKFAELGAELVVCDYRGYGRSDGTPELRLVLRDASMIYMNLRKHSKLLPKICVMGRSLGSASVIELCSRFKEIDACIIESGYADPIPLVERRGLEISSITEEDDAVFNNARKITEVTCPLLVMHGEDDDLIFPGEAEQNYRQAGSAKKVLKILEGVGHNDILTAPENAYFDCLHRFLRHTAGIV